VWYLLSLIQRISTYWRCLFVNAWIVNAWKPIPWNLNKFNAMQAGPHTSSVRLGSHCLAWRVSRQYFHHLGLGLDDHCLGQEQDSSRHLTSDEMHQQLVDIQRFCHLICFRSFWLHLLFSTYHWLKTDATFSWHHFRFYQNEDDNRLWLKR